MKIKYLGHSSLEITTQGVQIIVDPFISGNPKAKHIDINTLQPDYILLTHAHQDHLLDVAELVARTGAKIISNHEIVTYFQTHNGFDGHGMNHGGSWDFEFGRLKAVNAIHSSSFPDGTYGGNPLGFVLTSENKSIYIAGDTALTMDMKLIPLFYKLDLAILPVGGNYTMDIEEALIASDFIECSTVLGVHFDTFPVIEINQVHAIEEFKLKGKALTLLPIGESIKV